MLLPRVSSCAWGIDPRRHVLSDPLNEIYCRLLVAAALKRLGEIWLGGDQHSSRQWAFASRISLDARVSIPVLTTCPSSSPSPSM